MLISIFVRLILEPYTVQVFSFSDYKCTFYKGHSKLLSLLYVFK